MDYLTMDHKSIAENVKPESPPLSDESRFDYNLLDRFGNNDSPNRAYSFTSFTQHAQLKPSFPHRKYIKQNAVDTQQKYLKQNSIDLQLKREISPIHKVDKADESYEPEAELLNASVNNASVNSRASSSQNLMPCYKYPVKKLRTNPSDPSTKPQLTQSSGDIPITANHKPQINYLSHHPSQNNYFKSASPLKDERSSNLIPFDLEKAVMRYIHNESNVKLFDDEPLSPFDSNPSFQTPLQRPKFESAPVSQNPSTFLTGIEEIEQKRSVRPRPPLHLPKHITPKRLGKEDSFKTPNSSVERRNNKSSSPSFQNETYISSRSTSKVLQQIKDSAKPRISSNASELNKFAKADQQKLNERRKILEEKIKARSDRSNLMKNELSKSANQIATKSKSPLSRSPINAAAQVHDQRIPLRETESFRLKKQLIKHVSARASPISRNASSNSRSPEDGSNRTPKYWGNNLRQSEASPKNQWSRLKNQSPIQPGWNKYTQKVVQRPYKVEQGQADSRARIKALTSRDVSPGPAQRNKNPKHMDQINFFRARDIVTQLMADKNQTNKTKAIAVQ